MLASCVSKFPTNNRCANLPVSVLRHRTDWRCVDVLYFARRLVGFSSIEASFGNPLPHLSLSHLSLPLFGGVRASVAPAVEGMLLLRGTYNSYGGKARRTREHTGRLKITSSGECLLITGQKKGGRGQCLPARCRIYRASAQQPFAISSGSAPWRVVRIFLRFFF